MEVKAYAKLNLVLNVLGKREDGYHEVETLMTAIDLADNLSITKSSEDSVTMNTFIGPRQEENLAFKALKAMKARYRKGDKYNIYIEKNIPMAGGLGGGSADAAAVIYGLAKMWDLPVGKDLYEIAESLGTDVAFCLLTQTGKFAAIGRGRGEKLEPVSIPLLRLDLKTSEIHIKDKTASVYKSLIPSDYLIKYDIGKFLSSDPKNMGDLVGNHLQKPLERITGIENTGWTLCGAGPTYFIIDENGEYKTIV